jgi:hypothetical protein
MLAEKQVNRSQCRNLGWKRKALRSAHSQYTFLTQVVDFVREGDSGVAWKIN